MLKEDTTKLTPLLLDYRKKLISQAYSDGLSLSEIGVMFGISKQRVWQILSDGQPNQQPKS